MQVCWHKACKYFEIEAREAHVSDDCLVLTADRAKPLIDADTIGVCPILGSTFNGEYENVKEIHDMVVSYAVTKAAITLACDMLACEVFAVLFQCGVILAMYAHIYIYIYIYICQHN
jgi:Pyridoxal-dependent decarboxylase conserved domain